VKTEASKLTLKTRAGLRTLLLRADTHYSDATEPLLNKHVFVRAGRTLQGALEAYHVVWGKPRTVHSIPQFWEMSVLSRLFTAETSET